MNVELPEPLHDNTHLHIYRAVESTGAFIELHGYLCSVDGGLLERDERLRDVKIELTGQHYRDFMARSNERGKATGEFEKRDVVDYALDDGNEIGLGWK